MRNFKLDVADRALNWVQVVFDVNRMSTTLTRLRLETEHFISSRSGLGLTYAGAACLGHRASRAISPSGSESPAMSRLGAFSPQQAVPRQARRSAASVGLAARSG